MELPPKVSEVPLLETASLRSTPLTEECGTLTGNQWVGGTSPSPFINCFNELALPDLSTHKNCAPFCAPFISKTHSAK